MSANSALPPRIIFVKSGGGGRGDLVTFRNHSHSKQPAKLTQTEHRNLLEKLAGNRYAGAGPAVFPEGVLGVGNGRVGQGWEVISMLLCWSLFSRSSVAWPEPRSMPAEVS